MLAKAWRYLEGNVTIMVEGGSPERFLNLATGQGIYPWDMRWVEGRLFCSVPARGFRDLRAIARRSGSRVRIMGKAGLPFFLLRAKRRRMLVFGALLCLGAVYAMSSMVWFVEVTGTERIDADEVIRVAMEEGLAPGAFRYRLDMDRIRNRVVLQIPGLSWVGIHQKGTLVVIEVVEKTLHPDPSEDEQPGPIVALKDSLLVEVLALRGSAIAEPGRLVRQGEVLIEPDGDTGLSRGLARGKSWYQGYGECSFTRKWVERTGQSSTSYVLIWRGREIMRVGRPRYLRFQEEARGWGPLSWRNLNLPVEFLSIDHHEIRVYEETLGRETAKRDAMNAALQAVRSNLPAGAERSDIWAEVIDESPGFISVRVTVETLEDIASRPGDIMQDVGGNAGY